MGKLRKDVIDEIRRLGGEGYTQTEIADTINVDRGTVRKYLVGADSPLVLEKTGEPRLSDGVMKTLYDMQGIMGCSSIADAVIKAYRDELSAIKFKLNTWEEYAPYGEEFSVEGLIEKLLTYGKELESELHVYEDGYSEDQKTITDLREKIQERYDEGYAQGRRDYMIVFRCSRCGGPIAIRPGDEVHEYLMERLAKDRWQHAQCG